MALDVSQFNMQLVETATSPIILNYTLKGGGFSALSKTDCSKVKNIIYFMNFFVFQFSFFLFVWNTWITTLKLRSVLPVMFWTVHRKVHLSLIHLTWRPFWNNRMTTNILPPIFVYNCLKRPSRHNTHVHSFVLSSPVMQNCFRHARNSWEMTVPSELLLLNHGKEIIMQSNYILDSPANFFVLHMVFVGTLRLWQI